MPQRRSATALRRTEEREGTRTVIVALLANIVIAVAKLIGGLVSGSSGMLAEAAHSAADSVNEVFLAVGLHRARQPADANHPFGHGRERFLWAFVADGVSWLQSLRQARRQAKDYGTTVWRYLVRASDPVVRAVLVEDSAAL